MEAKEKVEANPLLATSTTVGIDITTNDLILNNISFPCQQQEKRHTPVYTSGNSECMSVPKQVEQPISPITITATSDHNSKLVESIDDLLSQAKAESYRQDLRSNSSYTEYTHQWPSTHLFEYNHGHDSYSPNRPQMTTSQSHTSGRSSTPEKHQPIGVYQTIPRIKPPTPRRKVTLNRPEKRCPICEKVQTNMKKHLAVSHLGTAWWGILADINCWKCRTYHNKEGIGRCNGIFNPELHSQHLLQRHTDFFRFMMEDLNCASVQQLLALVKREGLCDKCVSSFSMEEVYFLNAINNMTGMDSPLNRDPKNPKRLTDLLHWKTLAHKAILRDY